MMTLTEQITLQRENDRLNRKILNMTTLINEQQTRILQYQRENNELRKRNDNLHQTFFGELNVCKGGFGASKEIYIRGVSYVLMDEYEKLDSILRDKERRLEQIKAVANGDNY